MFSTPVIFGKRSIVALLVEVADDIGEFEVSSEVLINAVGGILYSNKKIGIVLLCTTLVTSIIIGIFCNFMFGKTYKESPSIYFNQQTKIPEITKLIEECVMPILKICAYIIFFSALMGCIKNIMVHFNINNSLQAMLYGTIELSGGTQAISLLNKNVFSMRSHVPPNIEAGVSSPVVI